MLLKTQLQSLFESAHEFTTVVRITHTLNLLNKDFQLTRYIHILSAHKLANIIQRLVAAETCLEQRRSDMQRQQCLVLNLGQFSLEHLCISPRIHRVNFLPFSLCEGFSALSPAEPRKLRVGHAIKGGQTVPVINRNKRNGRFVHLSQSIHREGLFDSDQNVPLPVELIEFQAKDLGNSKSQLNWSTASEVNSDYFEVLRSENGRDFTSIGTVTAAGDSDQTIHYSFQDESPILNRN